MQGWQSDRARLKSSRTSLSIRERHALIMVISEKELLQHCLGFVSGYVEYVGEHCSERTLSTINPATFNTTLHHQHQALQQLEHTVL